MTTFKLGKLPASHSVKLKFTRYADLSVLPTPPKVFGHQGAVSQWGMLGNDQYGDCVWAGAAHESMMWNAVAGKIVTFTDDSVLSDYSAVTGFRADDPSSDQGTDMAQAAKYRQKVGVADARGERHKVGAYTALSVGDVDQLMTAAYVFGAVGIGVQVPDFWMDAFSKGQPWDYKPGAKIEGGHYIPVVGRAANGNLLVVTWGKVQELTPAAYMHYNDEALCYFSSEMLRDGKSPEGFDSDQLTTDLRAV